ncbi:MAG: hypothetical protein H5U00_12515, partial [Clostridia bacterium]|nr:hypothetical protein [Clostridia bacterium]
MASGKRRPGKDGPRAAAGIAAKETEQFRSTPTFLFGYLRRRGYNTRFLGLVGGGGRGRRFLERLRRHPELGLELLGYLADDPRAEAGVDGLARLGAVADTKEAKERNGRKRGSRPFGRQGVLGDRETEPSPPRAGERGLAISCPPAKEFRRPL